MTTKKVGDSVDLHVLMTGHADHDDADESGSQPRTISPTRSGPRRTVSPASPSDPHRDPYLTPADYEEYNRHYRLGKYRETNVEIDG